MNSGECRTWWRFDQGTTKSDEFWVGRTVTHIHMMLEVDDGGFSLACVESSRVESSRVYSFSLYQEFVICRLIDGCSMTTQIK